MSCGGGIFIIYTRVKFPFPADAGGNPFNGIQDESILIKEDILLCLPMISMIKLYFFHREGFQR